MPQIAKAWTISSDGKMLTLQLRRGMKWSDGHPFTADDVMFWYQDMLLNRELTKSNPPFMSTKGGLVVVEKVDDATIRFKFADPYYGFVYVCAAPGTMGGQANEAVNFRGGYAPKHYLTQFHAAYASKEDLDQKVQAGKFDNWISLFRFVNSWHLNPDLPVLSPWKTVTPANTPNWTMERNPYHYAVDTAGNQLPYIDKVSFALSETAEVINLRAIAGEYDEQERHMDLAKLPVFIENQQKGGYKVHLDPSQMGTDMGLNFNLSYEADPEVAKWLANTDFRRALSLAMDRDQLNETFWLGTGTPGSAVVGESSPFNPGPEFRKLWSTYDAAKANQLLDQLGLTNKDPQGLRLRTDGKGPLRLGINTYVGFFQFTQAAQMISEQWKKVGIAADVTELERSLSYSKKAANDYHIHVDVHWGTENMFAQLVWTMLPLDGTAAIGPLYGRWYETGGKEGKEPPPKIKEAMDAYLAASSAPDAERIELAKKVWRIAADEVWTIGTVGLSPAIQGLRIAKGNLKNVPARMFNGASTNSPGQTRPETYFFQN
jgi:peptide/nickel transport system substrate-binding protein